MPELIQELLKTLNSITLYNYTFISRCNFNSHYQSSRNHCLGATHQYFYHLLNNFQDTRLYCTPCTYLRRCPFYMQINSSLHSSVVADAHYDDSLRLRLLHIWRHFYRQFALKQTWTKNAVQGMGIFRNNALPFINNLCNRGERIAVNIGCS